MVNLGNLGAIPRSNTGVFLPPRKLSYPMAVCTDDVLIIGVERDYDCLCLGEDKASKQKRLLAKALGKEEGPVETKSGKGLESREVEVTCAEDSATKPNSTQSSSETHDQADKVQGTTMQQFPHQPVVGSVYPHPHQHGVTPSNIAHAQPLVAPTTSQVAFNGGTNSYENPQGLAPAQQTGAASASQPQDGDLDWISTSEWDTFLNGLPLIADTDQKLAPATTPSNNIMMSKGTSESTSSAIAMASSSAAALHGSSTGASGSSSVKASGAAPGPQSGTGFANFADTTEKDSATQSASLYTHNSLFNSTNYQASSATYTPNTANQTQNPNLTSCYATPTTQSNSSSAPIVTPVDHSPPTSIAHNSPPQTLQLQRPVNTFQAQHQQQGYSNTSMATGLPNYQAPPTPAPIQYPVSNGSVQRQQQGYPSVPSSHSPVNSNNAVFFHPSPNSHAPMPPQATQPQSANAQQLPFNTGTRAGAISAPSNSRMAFAQHPSFNNSHPSPASSAGTEHLQNDEVLARKLQEDEYIKGMRRSKHGDERLAMSLLANDLSIGQARNSIPNNAQYPQQQQQFPPPSAMQIAGPSNFSTNVNEQLNATVLSNADKVLGDEQREQGPGGNVMKHPTCWTQCPNCPSEATRKYHLIDVERGSPEWNVVSQPLFNSGFTVEQVQRIQNETLWQRLCFEKQLMLRDRPSCNEKFLYHTSRAKIAVICEEGLDPRLSRNGLFGSGIYFR